MADLRLRSERPIELAEKRCELCGEYGMMRAAKCMECGLDVCPRCWVSQLAGCAKCRQSKLGLFLTLTILVPLVWAATLVWVISGAVGGSVSAVAVAAYAITFFGGGFSMMLLLVPVTYRLLRYRSVGRRGGGAGQGRR